MIITWQDSLGRVRVTSVGSGIDSQLVIDRLRGHYGLPPTHEMYIIDEESFTVRVTSLGGNRYRYPVSQPGDYDSDNNPTASRISRYGWYLDQEGLPLVAMGKAREIHLDQVRSRAEKLGIPVPTVDVSSATTPAELSQVWPVSLGDY